MTESSSVNRRDFMKTAGVTAAGAMLFNARSYGNIIGANDRIRIGLVGCGVIGRHHLDKLLGIAEDDNFEIIAISDVYRTRAERFQERVNESGGKAEIVDNYEKILEMADVDKVLIATPEHSHAWMTLDALDAGKHVYVEKPMTHKIAEGLRVLDKAKETGLKLQVGVQGMADDSYSSAHEAIKGGALGNVVQAQIDYVRRYGELGPWRIGDITDRNKPDDLDWNAWLRPAKRIPWDPHHYFEWRCYSEYSGGVATDLFIHRLTRIIKACGLTFPERVTGMGGIYSWDDGRDLPDSFELLAEYGPIAGITNGMTVHVLGTMANSESNSHCIRGDKATLYFRGAGWEIKDAESGEITMTHERTGGEDVDPHHRNHHKAIREGAELNCPPELGLYGVVACSMANDSWRQKRMLSWNPRRQRVERSR